MKTYRVVGSRKIRGYSKGETFRAELSPEQECRLVEAGHITVVPRRKPPVRRTIPPSEEGE